jgi:outer membrane protein OmpA-like peptidoglycan-associated protein
MTFDEEQRKEMLPLATARATAVKKALVDLGFSADKISIEAYGGLKPLVKFEDMDNNWKNRRVEIVLVKKK